MRFDLKECNMARISLALYGVKPFYYKAKDGKDLKMALKLISHIDKIQFLKKGESVGYGRHYRVKEDFEKIAVISLSYYDNLCHYYKQKANVSIRGQKAPFVTSSCMDYSMINVTNIENADRGDEVVVFGHDLDENSPFFWLMKEKWM